MALLSSCWLIIESIVIQDGFLKWSYMKLYMHPLVLFLCQLLLWLHLFFFWLLTHFQAFYIAFSSVLVMFSKVFSSFLRVIMVRRREVACDIVESRKEIKNTLVNFELSRSVCDPVPAFSFSFKDQVDSQLKVLLALHEGRILEEEEEEEEDQEDGIFYECDQEEVVDQLLDAKEGEEEEEEGRILEEEEEQEDQEDGIFYECDQEEVVDQLIDAKEGEEEEQECMILVEEEQEVQEDGFFYECDQEEVVDQILDAKEGEEEEEEDIEIIMNMEKNLEFELQTAPMDQEDENSLSSNDDGVEDIVNSSMENDLASLVASDEIDSVNSEDPSPFSISSLDSMLQDSIAIENQAHQDEDEDEDEETDEVYKKYCERMRWFDILSRDRSYGLSVITNQETASSLSLWGKTAEKRLKQSIEKDLELVYVAQSCLSWEALQHQYTTIRDSSKPVDPRSGFYTDEILREFQKFQVLLERFLEDERVDEGKRVLSFVQRRFEVMSFFQVPRLLGYTREGLHEGEKERKHKEVLKAIEKCIEVFHDFLKIDIKRLLIWERLKISFMNSPLMELEDPRDINLFLDLKNSLRKKEQLLKKLQGSKKKKKNWLKKKKSSNMEEEEDEIEKDENFMLVKFIMIELKLVSRVLHMSLVSSSHLKWCQHKLNNIHFNGGIISRTSSSHVLFPSS